MKATAPRDARVRTQAADVPLSAAQRLAVERVLLAMVLPAVAGDVNAIGFRLLGSYVSHVTGHATRTGLAIAQGDFAAARHTAFFIGMFFVGAFIATSMITYASDRNRARYLGVLLFELACLATFGSLTAGATAGGDGSSGGVAFNFDLAALLCLAMGLQNAMVTQISGAVVRTTHVTGLTTDSAVELSHLMTAVWRSRFGGGPRTPLTAQPAFIKLRLHVCILSSFVAGAVGGCWLHISHAELALMVPCVILAGLAIFDAMHGLRGMRGIRQRRRATDVKR